MQFLIDNKALILGLLFALSEVLALFPAVKANSVFQLIFGWLQTTTAPAPKV